MVCCLVSQVREVTSPARGAGFHAHHDCPTGWMDHLIVRHAAVSRPNGPVRVSARGAESPGAAGTMFGCDGTACAVRRDRDRLAPVSHGLAARDLGAKRRAHPLRGDSVPSCGLAPQPVFRAETRPLYEGFGQDARQWIMSGSSRTSPLAATGSRGALAGLAADTGTLYEHMGQLTAAMARNS